VLNCDDEYVAKFGDGLAERAVFYGLESAPRFVRCTSPRSARRGGLHRDCARPAGERATQSAGRHNVHNALAAIAVGLLSGMELAACTAALGELRAGNKRGEVTACEAPR